MLRWIRDGLIGRRYMMAEGDGGGDGGDLGGDGEGDVIVDPGTGGGEGPWYETHLTDEGLRSNPALQKFDGVEPLAKGYIELEKKIGERQGLQLPGDDATPEQINEFYNQLGRPQTPDDYNVPPPEIPEGMPALPEGRFESYLQAAHQAGLTDKQAQTLVQWYGETLSGDFQSMQEMDVEARNQGYEGLRRMWGAQTDRNMAVAMEGLRREFGADNLSWLQNATSADESGNLQLLGNHPQFLRIAYEWARSKGHDRFVPGGAAGVGSQQEAQARIDQARKDVREGKISEADFNAVQQRYGPLAYGHSDDGLVMNGAMTSVDFMEDER